MSAHINSHDSYYLTLNEPDKSCLLAVKDIILSVDAHITTDLKYGMPFFCYQEKMLCYVWKDKSTPFPYIGFVDGQLMNSPYLSSGTRKRMAVLPIDPNSDIPLSLIQELIQKAIQIKLQ